LCPLTIEIEEEFLVLPAEKAAALSDLDTCCELLTSGEPLVLKLDRNLQVFKPSLRAAQFTLPDNFFNLTVEDIRREQRLR
jgi:UBX domain-containing protein 6